MSSSLLCPHLTTAAKIHASLNEKKGTTSKDQKHPPGRSRLVSILHIVPRTCRLQTSMFLLTKQKNNIFHQPAYWWNKIYEFNTEGSSFEDEWNVFLHQGQHLYVPDLSNHMAQFEKDSTPHLARHYKSLTRGDEGKTMVSSTTKKLVIRLSWPYLR